jgi:hypothetical protein
MIRAESKDYITTNTKVNRIGASRPISYFGYVWTVPIWQGLN